MYYDSIGNKVLIDRHKKYQYEFNTTTKVKTQYRIKWLSDCFYTLTQGIANSKAKKKFRGSTTNVEIVTTDGVKGYVSSCRCNAGNNPAPSITVKKMTKEQYYKFRY